MSPSAPAPAAQPGQAGVGRILAASMVGAVLEWYDFAVYGILAATVLGPAFFPGHDDTAKLLLALGTQGLGFVARPLGGVVFGNLGDRFGRKPMLLITLILLGLATTLIGLLPTYASWGISATFLLVFLRLVQGFALGGEFGAAILLASEYATPNKRGWWAAWPQTGGPAGTLIATAVLAILRAGLGAERFAAWGWRLSFLVALPVLALGYIIRRGVDETPAFKKAQAAAAATKARGSSVIEALKHPRPILHGIGVRIAENVAFYIFTTFVVAYASKNLRMDLGGVLNAVTFASGCQFVGMLIGGAASDRLGRKPVMLTAAVVLGLWGPVFFALAQQRSLPLLWLGTGFGAFVHGLLAGPEAAWIAELFPTRYRYAGSSIASQVSSIFAGAPAPLIAVWLVTSYGPRAVVAYLVVCVVITIVAVATGPETKGIVLATRDPDVVGPALAESPAG